MNILLVGSNLEENLSLGYLTASIQQGNHKADIIPFNSKNDTENILNQVMNYSVIGLSMIYQFRAMEFITLANKIKQKNPESLIIAGGHYASCSARELLINHREFDFIVIGEGEHTLRELLTSLENKTDYFKSIKGLALRREGQIVFTELREKEKNLDNFPMPVRSSISYIVAGIPTAYIMGSRGCMNDCAFCSISTLHKLSPGPVFRQRSVQNIITEMKDLYFHRGIRQFIFHDDNFLTPSLQHNLNRIHEFKILLNKEEIKKISLVIKCCPKDVNEKVFHELKSIGLNRVFLGIESSDDLILKSLQRKDTVKDVENALDICNRKGISFQFNMMLLTPESTMDSIENDIEFMKQHVNHPFNLCKMELYAGIPMEKRLEAENRVAGNYLSKQYNFREQKLDILRQYFVEVFYDRCWASNALMQRAITYEIYATLLGYFFRGSEIILLIKEIKKYIKSVNINTVTLFEELYNTIRNMVDEKALTEKVRSIIAREKKFRDELTEEGIVIFNKMNILIEKRIGFKILTENNHISKIKKKAKTALAVAIITALGLSSSCMSCQWVSEPAPEPMPTLTPTSTPTSTP